MVSKKKKIGGEDKIRWGEENITEEKRRRRTVVFGVI